MRFAESLRPIRLVACAAVRLVLAGLFAVALCLQPVAAEPDGSGEAANASYCFAHEPGDGPPWRVCIRLASYVADVCDAIHHFAGEFGLPAGYFARLIWQESHFDANAVSSAGAQGIAQFMPSTGRLQGLANPYNPVEELWRSARYLRSLADRFGNLGLAAAAYNGGEGAAGRFIAGTGYLAAETLDYVQIVTGIAVTDWLVDAAPDADYALAPDKPFDEACADLAATGRVTRFTPPTAIVRPWGIQLAQFFSQATARHAFERIQKGFDAVLGDEELMLVVKRNPNFGPALRYTAEVGRDSRDAAESLCKRLQKAGGACIVVRN